MEMNLYGLAWILGNVKKCKGFPDLSKIHKLDKLYWLSTLIALNRNSLIVEHSLFVVSRTETDFDLFVG